MEFLEDHGFGRAWILYNGHYLITFPDSSIESFKTKREYQEYIRKLKRYYDPYSQNGGMDKC